MVKETQTIETQDKFYQDRVKEWTQLYCEALENNYKLRGYKSDEKFIIKTGKRFHKIVQEEHTQDGRTHNRGVHSFVEKDTGKVYKAASWSQPAKGYRYDMRIDQHRELLHNPKFVDWAGSYLYKR